MKPYKLRIAATSRFAILNDAMVNTATLLRIAATSRFAILGNASN